MALDEGSVGVTDKVQAELVDCTPEPTVMDTPLPVMPEASPTEQSQDATIEQTGAGPPPRG